MNENEREQRIIEQLGTRGFKLRKSRQYDPPGNLGEYMVYDPLTGASLLGHRFDARLDDIGRWIQGE